MTDRELFIKALNALEWNLPVIQDYGDKEQLNIQHNSITALHERLAQPEQGTGNLLKDAYNAMVEKKTRSQKLREAGFTRRPKGWEKEKDEQEPFEYWNAVEGWVKIDEVRQHFDSVGCGTIYKTSGEDRVPVYTNPPQRKLLTKREVELIDGMIEVELRHAERCDHIANRNMAEKQKGWDMERVALLRKIKENNT